MVVQQAERYKPGLQDTSMVPGEGRQNDQDSWQRVQSPVHGSFASLRSQVGLVPDRILGKSKDAEVLIGWNRKYRRKVEQGSQICLRQEHTHHLCCRVPRVHRSQCGLLRTLHILAFGCPQPF